MVQVVRACPLPLFMPSQKIIELRMFDAQHNFVQQFMPWSPGAAFKFDAHHADLRNRHCYPLLTGDDIRRGACTVLDRFITETSSQSSVVALGACADHCFTQAASPPPPPPPFRTTS